MELKMKSTNKKGSLMISILIAIIAFIAGVYFSYKFIYPIVAFVDWLKNGFHFMAVSVYNTTK
jgi:ABC-type Mn2+/Zn2+ transport system permease subunit